MKFLKIYMALLAMTAIFHTAASQNVVYTDASEFPVYGKVAAQTSARYERLPSRSKP